METAPIFIIGTERSGSNLLRLILNTHSGIDIPHPPHVLKFFTPFEKSYQDLAHPENLRRLVNDLLGLLAVHIHQWDIRPTADEVMAGATPSDLIGVFFSLYNAHLRHSGKRRWGCKSTFVVDHAARVLSACPTAKFLFLVRDPRDVAVSSRKAIFSPFHPFFTADLWRRQQLAGLSLLDSAPESCMLVRYEDLIREPENTTRQICAFISEEFEPAMLEFYRTRAARQCESLSESWHYTASPIQADNLNKFLTELLPAEITLIEELTSDLMQRFGYQPVETPPRQVTRRPPPGFFTICRYRIINFYLQMTTELRALVRDRNYPLFCKRRFFLFRLRCRFFLRDLVSAQDGV